MPIAQIGTKHERAPMTGAFLPLIRHKPTKKQKTTNEDQKQKNKQTN